MGEESNAEMDVENMPLRGKELSYEEIVSLREHLYRLSVKEIKFIVKSLSIRLTSSSKKADIIEWLMAMAQIGAIQKLYTRERRFKYFIFDTRYQRCSSVLATIF